MPNKMYKDCDPQIVNRKHLSTWEYEFMDTQTIKDKCNCIQKSTCLETYRLLSIGKWEEAEKYLSDYKPQNDWE